MPRNAPDERIASVNFSEDFLIVGLKDGRQISVPIEWYPRLAHASEAERAHWQVCGGGYGIHWPDIDEDLSTEGLLRGAPAPGSTARPSARRELEGSAEFLEKGKGYFGSQRG